MDECVGWCKNGHTERYVGEMRHVPGRMVPYLVLHDADRCMAAAVKVVTDQWPVFAN